MSHQFIRPGDRCDHCDSPLDGDTEARRLFLKYGQHLGSCAGPGECNCEFREALASQADAKAKQG